MRRRPRYRRPVGRAVRRYQPRDYRGRYTRDPRPRTQGPWWGPLIIFGIIALLVLLAAL